MTAAAKKAYNAFSGAERVSKPSAKPASKKDFIEVEGIAEYNAVAFAEKEIKTLKETMRNDLLPVLYPEWVKGVARTHKPPESFKAWEGGDENSPTAVSSCQCQKKSTREKLTPEVCEILEKNNIPYETIWEPAHTYIINPELLKDEKMVAKLGEGIGKLLVQLGLPENTIQEQVGVSRNVVSDETLRAVARLNDPDKIAELLPLVTTPVIKPVKEEANTLSVVKFLGKLIDKLTGNREAKV